LYKSSYLARSGRCLLVMEEMVDMVDGGVAIGGLFSFCVMCSLVSMVYIAKLLFFSYRKER
jgi:hypothetical protein